MKESKKGGALTETTFYILLATFKPNHGYGIMQFIDDKTNSRLHLSPGTLYGAIKVLREKKWLIEYETQENGKVLYLISDDGKSIVKKEFNRMIETIAIAKEIMEEN